MEKKKKGKKVGRHPKYDSLESLLEGINKFFALCEKKHQLPEKAGLCVFLGISRETYSQYKKQFPDAIRFANNYIESNWVRRLGGASATGAIFYLKNAFRDDFKDRHETDVTSHGEQIQQVSVAAMTAEQVDEYLRTKLTGSSKGKRG